MKKYLWEIGLGIVLLILSVSIYLAQVYIFNSARDTMFYLFQDLAFLPVQVFLVTIVLNQFIIARERRQRLRKLNMIIGVFFSQAGTEFLKRLSYFDSQIQTMQQQLVINADWSKEKFSEVKTYFSRRSYEIKLSNDKLEPLKDFLVGQRSFLSNLLGNPSLLEHERFTELLWAMAHLSDELSARQDLSKSGARDFEHIAGDIKRVYSIILHEWIIYMEHLKENYPYLFSLSMRSNPFNPAASVIIKD